MDVDVGVIVPVNIMPLLDDTDFKTIEIAVVYDSAGMDLVWNFVPCAGPAAATAVTPTTAGNYDWTEHIANKGMYSIEIPASGGASINNNTEGVGWFTGVATGILPWRGPTIGFRRAALNDLLIEGSTASTNLEDFFDGTGYAGGTAKLTVDVSKWLGTAASTPTVAGVPNVNVKTWNDLTTVALPLIPTTAGRTLDVSVGGEAGVDWANVGSPTTALALTGTTIATTQKVDVETIKTNAVVNAGTVTFPTTATLASTTNITAGTITTVTNLTNAPTSGDLTATMKTSVNAEVVDALNTDTYAEPAQGAPAATATLAAKINYLYKAWRNKKTQTATQWSLFNDDAATIDHKATVSDDATTATKGEIATGP